MIMYEIRPVEGGLVLDSSVLLGSRIVEVDASHITGYLGAERATW